MKLYRVRIETYDTDTEESEVLLTESEDEGYTGLVFFGVTEDGALRNIVQHMRTTDIAAALMSDECFRAAAHMTALSDIMHKRKGDEECPQ